MAAAGPANPVGVPRPRPAPPALGGVSWFQNFVRLEDGGATEVYSLPTGSRACRALMLALCMNDEEGTIASAPSHDILFRVSSTAVLADMQAKFVRREGYFRAILVQSRGQVVVPCLDGPRGGCRNHYGTPFDQCRTVYESHSS